VFHIAYVTVKMNNMLTSIVYLLCTAVHIVTVCKVKASGNQLRAPMHARVPSFIGIVGEEEGLVEPLGTQEGAAVGRGADAHIDEKFKNDF
jgi:hypothetical protein